uniref:Huntingtin-interacting protein 1-related protein n=1 Tax=Malurus cyaneus samueli TaxID=2593467 RepID=A0A8C5TNN4_9PASS
MRGDWEGASTLPISPPYITSLLQTVSINKAINAQEVAVKEKHARNILPKAAPCILGTHHEKGAQTFWSVVNRLPLSGNAVLCWKFCHVFHKLLRDGHSNVTCPGSQQRFGSQGHLSEGYGQLCSIYLKLLRTKMEFHTKVSSPVPVPKASARGGQTVWHPLVLPVLSDVILHSFPAVFSSLDMSRSVSVTAAGQCRLAPLIQVILDCSHLYDYTVKLLFKLHSCLPADTLQGHRDRFLEQFRNSRAEFQPTVPSAQQQYQSLPLSPAPLHPQNPPNFLRASALSEHISPVVVIPAEASSPDNEPITDLVEMDTASQVRSVWALWQWTVLLGIGWSWWSPNSPGSPRLSLQSTRGAVQLRGRASELEAELAEQQHLQQQAQDESEFLRTELEELKKQREDTEKAQRSLTEIERRAQANEQRYSKLKEKYSELVQNHADLLRKNAEVTKQVTVARQAQGDVEREKKELEDSFQRVSEQAQRKVSRDGGNMPEMSRGSPWVPVKQPLPLPQSQEQAEVLETLKRELAASRQELQVLQDTLESSTQVRARGGPPAPLWASCSAGALNTALAQQESAEQALQQQLAKEKLSLLQDTAREGERMVQDALARMEDPAHVSCTGSADCLLSQTLAASECAERLQDAHSKYLSDCAAVGSLLPCLALFTHLVSDTILQGSATSHVAPVEPADRLLELCKQCGSEAVSYLSALQDPAMVANADCSLVTACLGQISTIGEELRPRGLDIKQEELGDLVDKEMAATAAAIETASARIEEMLSKARAGDTGVKLEVNERILGSCTGLMQAIHVLVLASKDLQREIVESGRGAASPKEFYAKNSRWTEGLISASKAVGWGATVMVDAADLVVQGKGTFEELMVCSREIAASTAQLVAASKVKADKDSANLCKLQQASRGVNQATASVVASTKAGKSQVEEKDSMDFSSMTLTQIKRQEMDSQVRVLELENQLQKERQKLGELRKKHYELAGVAEGWEEDGEWCQPCSSWEAALGKGGAGWTSPACHPWQ